MPVKQISATVHEEVYGQFEQVYRKEGLKKSHALEEAIKLWLKAKDDALMAEGCRLEREEDRAFAKMSMKNAAQTLPRE